MKQIKKKKAWSSEACICSYGTAWKHILGYENINNWKMDYNLDWKRRNLYSKANAVECRKSPACFRYGETTYFHYECLFIHILKL